MKQLFLLLLEFYRRFISPLKPPCCRFYPSCSLYAKQALIRFGAAKGGWLALRRILKCHPFHKGGYDPVPEYCDSGGKSCLCASAFSLTKRAEDMK